MMKKKEFFIITGVFLLIIFFLAAFFFLDLKDKGRQKVILPNASADQTSEHKSIDMSVSSADPVIADVVRVVGKHLAMPKGDVTVATVVDAEALRGQNPVFYKYAQKGDKVLLFQDRAVLYNPTQDIIIDFARF